MAVFNWVDVLCFRTYFESGLNYDYGQIPTEETNSSMLDKSPIRHSSKVLFTNMHRQKVTLYFGKGSVMYIDSRGVGLWLNIRVMEYSIHLFGFANMLFQQIRCCGLTIKS